MIDTLTTERLVLRTPRPEDVAAYAAGIGNVEVARFLTPVPHPYSQEMAADYLAKAPASAPDGAFYVIELAGTGLIGCVTLITELGYWIAQPHWGKGYVTEAAAALLSQHFGNNDNTEVQSSAMADNPASLAVQAKLGFKKTGRSLRFSQTRQCDVEHVETVLTREDFRHRGYLQ